MSSAGSSVQLMPLGGNSDLPTLCDPQQISVSQMLDFLAVHPDDVGHISGRRHRCLNSRLKMGVAITNIALTLCVLVVTVLLLMDTHLAGDGEVLATAAFIGDDNKDVHSVIAQYVNQTIQAAVTKLEERVMLAENAIASYNATLMLLDEFLRWKQTEGTRLEACLNDVSKC